MRAQSFIYIPYVGLNFDIQPITFGMSLNLNLQSQYPPSLFHGMWQKRPRKLDYRFRFEIEAMSL